MAVASLPAAWEEVWTDYEIPRGRSLRPRTLENYRDTLGQLAPFVGPGVTLEQVTRRHVAAYLDHVKNGLRHHGRHAISGPISRVSSHLEAGRVRRGAPDT
jgi:hypothetical protein